MPSTNRLAFACLVSLAVAQSAQAQNWTFDARRIALGANAGTENLATSMIEDEEPYGAIVIPFGLLQVLGNARVLNPGGDDFDLVRSLEFAASPIHYVVGRNTRSTNGSDLVLDLTNGVIQRDLNAYRGFVPAGQTLAGGLASPTFGATIPIARGARGFHGVFVGGGPYVSLRGNVAIDDRLRQILGSAGTNVYVANAGMTLGGGAHLQTAAAVVVGYRARLPLPGDDAPRNGLHVAFDYNYLRGLHYEGLDTTLRLDTDAAGMLTIQPFLPAPLRVSRLVSGAGRGRALDVGAGLVLGRWEMSAGIEGIGNQITWTRVQNTTYTLGNLLLGADDLVAGATQSSPDVRATLPLDVRTGVGYHGPRSSTLTAVGKSFNGPWWHGGHEQRFRYGALRGGAFYSRGGWQPSGGAGVNLGSTTALDVAVYGSRANIERTLQPTIAVSLRIRHKAADQAPADMPRVLPPVTRPGGN